VSVERAKSLRANSTVAERRVWRLLFHFRTGGFHFRKQVPIGPYCADIACHHARLVIEIDGDSHYSDPGGRHDASRDNYLRARGYRILRLSNAEVMNNPEGVVSVISSALAEAAPHQRSYQRLPPEPQSFP